MNSNLITAIAINLGVLLIASWIFGAFIVRSLSREKKQLLEQLHAGSPTTAPPSVTSAVPSQLPPDDLSHLLENMAEELQEKEDRINALLQIKDNHQITHNLLHSLTDNNANQADIASHLSNLATDHEEMESIIASLEKDLEQSRQSLAAMEEEVRIGEGRLARIAGLERTERRMRDENKKLLKSQISQQEDIDQKQLKVNQLRKENDRLKRTVKSLATASNEQLAVIKKLHAEVERAAQLEQHQRQLIDDLEQRLNAERNNGNNDEKVSQMEQELSELQDTLKRTLIEKEFIEEHMIELDDSLEKAKETEAALARARKEIETLEKHFPDFEPSPSPNSEAPQKSANTTSFPAFSTDIPELNNIMEDNRLFGSLQEFWMTLDVPPLNLISKENITRPSGIKDWIYVTIGAKDYTLLLTMNEPLAELVTQAIFKSEVGQKNDDEQKDATGELGNIVAGKLATELDRDFPVGIPEHIGGKEAEALLTQSTVVSEMLASAQENPLYAVLFIEAK